MTSPQVAPHPAEDQAPGNLAAQLEGLAERRGWAWRTAFPCSPLAYEQRSVAVPFGGCTEPSNVTAGGQACPIRFQCSGCGFSQ